MKNNKSNYLLLFLLLIVPIILSACSLSWLNSNNAILKNNNNDEQKEEINNNEVKEIEELYSHRLKVYSNYEDLNNFINNNKDKAKINEDKDDVLSNFLKDDNNQNVYKKGNIVVENENYIAYVNKDKLYLLTNNVDDSRLEIINEKQLDFSVIGIMFYNNTLIINGISPYNGDYVIDIYNISNNEINSSKQYFSLVKIWL